MKRSLSGFFIKLILALIPAIALIMFTAICPMCYMDEEYPAWKYSIDTVRKGGNVINSGVDDNIHTLILGDSRAMADLMPEKFSKSCINLAVGGATSIEMYYFYSEYLKNNAAPETAVVMFAPFHYSYIDNFKTRGTYFNALTIPQRIELYQNAKKCGADAVLFDDYAAYSISCKLRLPDVYLPAIYNAKFVGRLSNNKQLLSDLEKSHGQGYFGTDDYNNETASEVGYTQMKGDGNEQLIRIYMERLLDLLNESGARVILEQPPMNEATYDSLDSNYLSEYKMYITKLCENYDNVVYSADMIRYSPEYFGDPSHLNEKGANQFSEEFYTKYIDFL